MRSVEPDGAFNASTPWSGTCRTEVEERIAGFSNYGEGVELIAPGVCVLSTDRVLATGCRPASLMMTPGP